LKTLIERAAKGVNLFHPDDRMVATEDFRVEPSEEKLRQEPGEDGIERAANGTFRARPFWRGKKYQLGIRKTLEEARELTRAFWVERLGLFAKMRKQSHRWFADGVTVYSRSRRRVRRTRPEGTLFDTPEVSCLSPKLPSPELPSTGSKPTPTECEPSPRCPSPSSSGGDLPIPCTSRCA